MLTVTKPAVARLSALLGESLKDTAVRIINRGRRLKLRRDHARSGDETFTDGNRVVLVLDPRISRALATRTLDVQQTTNGPRLRLQPR